MRRLQGSPKVSFRPSHRIATAPAARTTSSALRLWQRCRSSHFRSKHLLATTEVSQDGTGDGLRCTLSGAGEAQVNDNNQFEVFLQGEGLREIVLLRVPKNGLVRDILMAARDAGALVADDTALSLEDEDASLDPAALIAATTIHHRSRVHAH